MNCNEMSKLIEAIKNNEEALMDKDHLNKHLTDEITELKNKIIELEDYICQLEEELDDIKQYESEC